MMIKKNILYILFAGFISVSLVSCGGKTDEKTNEGDEFEAAEKEINETIELVVYDIPSPSEIPGLLERTGVEFNESLLNDEEKVGNYTADNDKAAMNLGIYSTDIGYLISYDKVQDALNYMANSKKLADQLGLSGTFETAVIKKFESNLSNKDSLTLLLNQTINSSSDYLRSNERARLAALLLTGSLVEGLHISCTLIKEYPKDLPEDVRNAVLIDLIRVILEQEKSVSEVLNMLNSIESTEPVAGLIETFTKLNAAYVSLDIAEKIDNNQGDLILTDQNLVEITKVVGEVRSNIIN